MATDVLDRTDQGGETVEEEGPGASPYNDPFVGAVLPVVTHLLRYKWLYAVTIAWALVLLFMAPLHFGATGNQAAASSPAGQSTQASATDASNVTPAAATAGDLGATDLSGSTFASSDLGSTLPYGGSDSSTSSSSSSEPSGSTGSKAPAPAPPPPSCSADGSLPAPVFVTIYGALAPVPPADGAVGQAAGCTGGSAQAAATSTDTAATTPVAAPAAVDAADLQQAPTVTSVPSAPLP